MNIKLGIYSLIILGILNLIILDSIFLLKGDTKDKVEIPKIVLEETPSPTPFVSNICPQSCISQIYEATSSLKLVQSTPTPRPQTQSTLSVSKETYISLGSGSNSTDDWVDLPNAQEYIDSTKYGRIKTVTFEVTVRIPTGNQTGYVRLYNKTDKHPVWFSEVSWEGGGTKSLISKPITLDPGVKLYQVQMKTSLKFQAILDKAWVHIISF